MDIFNIILSYHDKIEDEYHHIDGKSYKVNKISNLTTFALNVILVLEGARPAYRVDTLLNLLPLVLELLEDLKILPYPKEEPLLINNKYNLPSLAATDDFHVIIGKILGYSYTGSDWINGIQDVYIINYVTNDIEMNEFNLYSFNVPIIKYDDQIKDDIMNRKNIIENTLVKYGHTTKVIVYLYLKNDYPREISLL